MFIYLGIWIIGANVQPRTIIPFFSSCLCINVQGKNIFNKVWLLAETYQAILGDLLTIEWEWNIACWSRDVSGHETTRLWRLCRHGDSNFLTTAQPSPQLGPRSLYEYKWSNLRGIIEGGITTTTAADIGLTRLNITQAPAIQHTNNLGLFQNCKTKTAVKLTAVSCPPVVEVKIKRPDTKYQLGFSVQNGVVSPRVSWWAITGLQLDI